MKSFIVLLSIISFELMSGLANVSANNLSRYMEGGLLWEISGNGLEHNSYLLGTMHNVGQSYLDSIIGFKEIFHSVKQIAIEYDVLTEDSISKTSKKKVPSTYSFMPSDITYEMLYNCEDYYFVDSILRKGNPVYFRYKPLFWYSFFYSMLAYKKIRKREIGMDRYISIMGSQSNKKLYFMESLEDVIRRQNYLDSLRYSAVDLRLQASALKMILQTPDSISNFNNVMEHLYKEQKWSSILVLDSINKQVLTNFKSENADKGKQKITDYWESTLTILGVNRNEKWMYTILPMIRRNSSLIAVGVMHLVGNEGLIARLREQGYKVEPVKK